MIEINWFDIDIYKLLLRMSINLVFLTIVIRLLYFPKNGKKEYLFTYYLIGCITFFLCFALKKLDIDTGMGLGLFAIFGIIRYRTDSIQIKEMTYLFIVIGLSVINSLSSNKVSMSELLIINSTIVILAYCLEYLWFKTPEKPSSITLENVSLDRVRDLQLLKSQLENETKLPISELKIGKVNLSQNTAQLKAYYLESEFFKSYQDSTLTSEVETLKVKSSKSFLIYQKGTAVKTYFRMMFHQKILKP